MKPSILNSSTSNVLIISYKNKRIPITDANESPINMLIPLFFLGLGAIFTGFIFKETFIGHHSNDFWQSSIFFLNEIKHENIPLWLLLATPILVIIAIPISFYYLKYKVLLEMQLLNFCFQCFQIFCL